MRKTNFKMRNVVAIAICLAGFTVFTGCDKTDDPIDPNNPPVVGELTELKSPITANTTLKDLGLPIDYFYAGTNLLQVKNNAILTIEDSVTIQFTNAGGGIEIIDGATIKALGTASKRIQFVGGAAKGSWLGIQIQTLNNNEFKYCDFVNGGSKNNGGTKKGAITTYDGGKVGISYCSISGSKTYGVMVADRNKDILSAFDHNTITACDENPIWVNYIAQAQILDNTSALSGNGKDYIEVSYATSVADVTLSETTVPYYIGNISCTGQFTINAGVTIYRAADSYFTAAGGSAKLLIKGTAEKPVLITRLPGTNEYWNEVRIYGTSGNSIEYCTFEYGGKGQYESLLYLTGSQETELTLKNCIFRNSYNYGIEIAYWDRDYLRLTHENVSFANNSKGNVYDWSADHIYGSLNELP